MKDFIKWLGVNEKIAKVVVWMLIFMVILILTNTMLESMGFPHYAITYDNLKKIETNELGIIISNCCVCILNFYAIILLVFKVKEAKPIFKYALIYMILNWLIDEVCGYVASQVFILIYLTIFGYYYSKKNWKYIIYVIGSLIFNTIMQGITYAYKVRFIDYTEINRLTQAILFSDYFIIMAIIILVKEIYIKKRRTKEWETDQAAGFGSENSKTKENSLKN